MRKVFDIPSHDYLVKFASKQFWPGYRSSPFPVNEKSMLGSYIFSLVIDKRSTGNLTNYEFNSTLSITLSDAIAKRSPDLVKLSRLNRFLDHLFKMNLIVYVRADEKLYGTWRAITNFLSFYDINDHEMVSRMYQFVKRYKRLSYTRKD